MIHHAIISCRYRAKWSFGLNIWIWSLPLIIDESTFMIFFKVMEAWFSIRRSHRLVEPGHFRDLNLYFWSSFWGPSWLVLALEPASLDSKFSVRLANFLKTTCAGFLSRNTQVMRNWLIFCLKFRKKITAVGVKNIDYVK